MGSGTRRFWILWLVGSLLLSAWLAVKLFGDSDKTTFMPGPLNNGHHQLADDCRACHTDPLGGGEVLQQACIDCHGQDREKPQDSHPRSKFKDPRNAKRLGDLDALHCVTCHSEHRPEITQANGVTQPRDLCFHCHEDVAEERPSHEGMPFDTCTNAGCHNFHDNRALYTNFLIKHLDEPETLPDAQLPEREFASLLSELADYPADRYPVQPLTLEDADAAPEHAGDATLQRDWLETAHARAGVNCSACHQPLNDKGQPSPWTDHPGQRACAACHSVENTAFGRGLHGMRPAAGLSPMTPAHARLPMKADASDTELGCTTCHGAHRFDVAEAAAQSCLQCHADEHSTAWKDSPHAGLWQQEQAGELPPGSGVSCASCHMPRMEEDINDWMSRIVVQHNQSAVQSPNSKMIRPSCLHCHGLEFTLDALADKALIQNNFSGKPSTHVDTMRLAEEEKKKREAKRASDGDDDTSMFGF